MSITPIEGKKKATIAPDFGEDDFIQIHGITKSFGVVKALKNVDFGIAKGEVHALLGENGAGKSTLVKIIMGEETPDSGSIQIDGKPIKIFSPEHSHHLGISMVHQELAVFENLTVAENIFPTRFFTNNIGAIDWKTLNRYAEESIALFNIDIKPTQKMDSLTLAQQQMVEILRCISNNQQIILLDEPTSGLNSEETVKLMNIIRDLRKKGITFIYISHRINEVLEISDKITILRDGRYVCTYINDNNLTEDDLVSAMVGHELTASLYSKKVFLNASDNPVLFKVEGLAKKNSLNPIEFELHEGEIIGFFGLEGSGMNTVSRMIYGLEGKQAGEITFKNEKLTKISPPELIKKKILYLNNDRKKAGLLLDSGASDNMMMPKIDELSTLTILRKNAIADYTEKYINLFSIVIPNIFTKTRNLSGGNQQKLMISMCVGTEPELMIVNEPTRGIDVGAKSEIHKFILESAKQGTGFIIFSSDLPELIGLCDRIYVMKKKSIVGELKGDAIDEESVFALAAGSKSEEVLTNGK
jgi:ABC-type sugar transport system ATPase subunit